MAGYTREAMTLAADTTASLDGLQHIVLDDISWDLYEHLLREVSGSTLRVTYHRGSVEIMSPLPKHETWKKAVAGFIEAMAFELNVASPAGQSRANPSTRRWACRNCGATTAGGCTS